MGWGDTWRPKQRSRLTWANADLNAAAAVCAAQLAVAGAIWWVGTFDDDTHGAGSGGGLAAAGLLCMLVFGPLFLAVVGLLHAVAHTMPAATLARLATRRVRGPEGAWHLAFVAVLGVLWAAVAVVLGVSPTSTTALLIAASGVLPALGVAYVRRRERATGHAPRSRRIWIRSALASFGVCVLVAVAGAVGLSTGLIEEYEPPKLTAAQLTGVWRGDGGAVLRLRTGGRAEFTALPAQPEFEDVTTKDFTRCDGTGSWFLDNEGRYDPYADEGGPSERDGVVVHIEDCGHDTYWTIGGSEAAPELFVLFGDPDSGDLRILKRDTTTTP
ncbi:hypothetical protein [Streptomyces sp. NPDC001530]|uniref:hypothetical protein n=1 Tax=Streptomyces sp. NPDC001530 TaxID=3364582 RepID=UPI0036C391B7